MLTVAEGDITASLLVSSCSKNLFSTLMISFFFNLPLGTLSAIVMTSPFFALMSNAFSTWRPFPSSI